jgi:hypothetical protein
MDVASLSPRKRVDFYVLWIAFQALPATLLPGRVVEGAADK